MSRLAIAALTFGLALLPGIARAQSPAPSSPAVPPAVVQRAGEGGFTAARASLPGENGVPLEPFLYLTILAGGGIIAFLVAVTTDMRVRQSAPPRSRPNA